MKNIRSIQLLENGHEELLPGFAPEFPYIATRAELNKYPGAAVPWHWHRTAELFYIQSGTLEYTTAQGKWIFPAGSGGMIRPNVLHSTRSLAEHESNVQLLHLFDPSLLAGEHGSRMERKYILPLTAASGIEMIPLHPADPTQAGILERIRRAFDLPEEEWGYEFKLREALTQIWLELFELARPSIGQADAVSDTDGTIKALIIYVQEHYQEPICVEQLAQAVHISKRACFRLFQENLHMTPVGYIRSCRLQNACRMLTRSDSSITQIAHLCGLGSSSYFGKVFREKYHCTPSEYRERWHDHDRSVH